MQTLMKYLILWNIVFTVCQSTGRKVIKLFSCSNQLSTKFILLINVKMPTINTTSKRLKSRNFFICWYFSQGWQSTGQYAYWPDQWSILVLTGHYWSIGGQLVDWKNMVDVKILSISYLILLGSINRLKIVSIKDNTGLIENVFHDLLFL